MDDLIDNDMIEETEGVEDCFVIFEREERGNGKRPVHSPSARAPAPLRTRLPRE